MSGLLWQLPGPARFIERVGQSFREGRNIVLALPQHGPAYLRAAVAELVTKQDLGAWHPINAINVEAENVSPAEQIARQCIPDERPCTAKALAECEDFRGMFIWVEGLHPTQWALWRDFLEDYSHVCRARPEHERAIFCIPVPGALTSELPREDVACVVHKWRGIMSRIDMLLLFSRLLAGRSLPRLHLDVWIAVGAELSGTDPALAECLATADLATVLQPRALLEEFARTRGWYSGSSKGTPTWDLGQEDSLDGRTIVHSARVILEEGGDEEIERRIWRGQVGILFPFLEEQRIEMLRRLERFLVVPHETSFGTVITDIRDFELGHLLYYARKRSVDRQTRRRVEQLAAIRHRLAHLEAVSLSDLSDLVGSATIVGG